jgi:DNA-binding FrmR family transcriptional regulator
MKTNDQLINNICGQLQGINKMIEEDQDPIKVVTQMKAARSAMNSMMSKYIQQHFWEVMSSCEDQEDACRKFLAELVTN